MKVEYEPYAKYHFRMIEAKDRGYYVDDGELFGPKGKIKVRKRGKQRYPTFTTNWGGVQSLPVHSFAAFCYYGYDVFNRSVHVRHLNGDAEDFSKSNIVLGTPSENEYDKPSSVRSSSARKARMSQGVIPKNAKLTSSDVEVIRAAYIPLRGKKAPNGFTSELAKRFGVSRTVIHRVNKGTSYES